MSDGVVITHQITKKPADPTAEGANGKGKSPPAPIPHNLPEKVNPRRSAYIEEVPASNDETPTPQYKPVHPPSTKTSGPHAPVPISTTPLQDRNHPYSLHQNSPPPNPHPDLNQYKVIVPAADPEAVKHVFERTLDAMRAFFDLPLEAKMEVGRIESWLIVLTTIHCR